MTVIKPHLYVWGNCFPIKASPFVHQLTLTCTKQTTTALLTNKNCYRPCKGIVMKAYSDSRLPHLTKYAAYSTAELSRIKVVPYPRPLRHQTSPLSVRRRRLREHVVGTSVSLPRGLSPRGRPIPHTFHSSRLPHLYKLIEGKWVRKAGGNSRMNWILAGGRKEGVAVTLADFKTHLP